MGITMVDKHDKYLGLPLIIGQKKKEVFKEIEEKVAKRVLGWKSRFLSMKGREVLIKAVLTAIPQYSMLCYKLPLSTCNKIQSLINKFWWSASGGKRPIYWAKENTLMRDKLDGGMGFRNLAVMNDALILKQAWRMSTQPELLVIQVFKGKYFAGGELIEAGPGSRPSHAWRGIHKIKNWLCFGIGDWNENGSLAITRLEGNP